MGSVVYFFLLVTVRGMGMTVMDEWRICDPLDSLDVMLSPFYLHLHYWIDKYCSISTFESHSLPFLLQHCNSDDLVISIIERKQNK